VVGDRPAQPGDEDDGRLGHRVTCAVAAVTLARLLV
jgi:hypothetical protein